MRKEVKVVALSVIFLVALSSCDTGSSGKTDATGTAGSNDTTSNATTDTTTDTTTHTGGITGWTASLDVTKPASPVRLVFIHHSCGQNWLSDTDSSYGGSLGDALNDNNYYVSDTSYGWNAEPGDNLGNNTNTADWPLWFNDTKMQYVYATASHSTWDGNDIAQPAGENEIVMFKSCYPLSEVGASIDDEKAVYSGLLTYFAAHQDKLFVLITPPGETEVSSSALTKGLCDWLVNRESGWLKDYAHKNVLVYDFYCTLSETGSHHTVTAGAETHVWDASYDGMSPYHSISANDHPDATGNNKATADFIPLLNAAYNYWK